MTSAREAPERQRVYRYTVEILDVANGEKRLLPLKGERCIPLIKDDEEAKRLTKEILIVQDGEEEIRAETFDEVRQILRDRYPDGRFERRLLVERDREEERTEGAIGCLIELVVEAAVRDIQKQAEGTS